METGANHDRPAAFNSTWFNRAKLGWGSIVLGLMIGGSLYGQEVTWIAPPDGGTPRDPARVERLRPGEFRIRAAYQEGGPTVLRHAVSRADLICRNTFAEPIQVTVHLDLSGDGQRTDFDNRPESGMPLRDFLFIQEPGEEWAQINGTTREWIATVRFQAQPGDTKLGLSPWYTYADFERWIKALPDHPHLTRRVIGQSDGQRDQWELTVTDPAVAQERKQTIFWHAREHAYETFSSYAMEGLVAFLLSDEAQAFRKRYRIVLHPMTNVDGVGAGYEYRAGYDWPNPRGTATARLTFDAIDRLQPQLAVTWHNWIAPRDRNVVFYTDGEGDRALPRAWLRLTQLFPSLHRFGHRWKDENTPQRYNWYGRTPLSEANVHQYAMKKYGTRVWGWEMPWWNCTPNDVRQAGASFGRAFLQTIDEVAAGSVPAATQNPPVEVPKWQMHEFTLQAPFHGRNPDLEGALVGEFVSPAGRTNVIDGFFDGQDTWRLRFAPEEEGQWKYLLRGEGIEALQQGTLLCTAPRTKGFIRIHPENPYAFAYADGTPFFPMGDTCYGLHDDSPITPELRAAYLQTRRTQRFNFVRMGVGQSYPRAATDQAYWAWGGTAQNPDLDRFNPVFFQRLDDIVLQLRASGMNIELILLNFYRPPFTDPKRWTPARERAWLRYLVARYGAFDHIFLWTLANEYETHPDGRYRLDFPEDVAWARASARLLKASDPYHHLVTVHPVISASRRGSSPRDPIELPWRIGDFFGADSALDVLSQQTGAWGDGVTWEAQRLCWVGDDPQLVESIRADRRYQKPVLNTESGYEYLRGHPTEKKQVHDTDKVRRSAWRIVCAGAYFAAGFNGTIGHSDTWNRLDAPNHYTFAVADEGAGAQLAALYDFFQPLPFWRMAPERAVAGDAVALADPGKNYVAYLPHGGSVTLDLTSASGELAAGWFNPRTGRFDRTFKVAGAAHRTFSAPDGMDWALRLTAALP